MKELTEDIELRTLTEKIARRLRDDILRGRWKPGAKLRVDELGAVYEVGGSPVREALSRLTSLGLVSAEGQRGFRVAAVSVDDLLDLTRARIWIEGLALRSAIARGDRAWEASILAASHMLGSKQPKLAEDPIAGHDQAWEKHHRAFHAALVSACASQRILSYREVLYDLSDRYRQLSVANGMPNRDAKAEHDAIMEAVLARDANLAIKLIADHFLLTTQIALTNIADLAGSAAKLIEKLRNEICLIADNGTIDPRPRLASILEGTR